jgi:ribonuclease P protein component
VIGSSTPRRIPLSLRRLHTPHMYKQVFESGRTLRGSPLTVRFLRAESDWSRVGFIIRKKSGDAPFRNSVRRTLRRSFEEALPSLAEGLWILFDVSDKAKAVTRATLKGEADRLLSAAGTAAAASPAIAVRVPPAGGRVLPSTGKASDDSASRTEANRGRRFRNRDVEAADRRDASGKVSGNAPGNTSGAGSKGPASGAAP